MATEGLSSGSGISMVDLLNRVTRRLRDEPYLEVLKASIADGSATSATWEANVDQRIKPGDRLDFLADGTFETVMVREITGNASTRVLRGYQGSTAAAHSAEAVARKNPAYFSHELNRAALEAIDGLWPRVPEIRSEEITVTAPVPYFFDLPTDAEEVIEVYQLVDANTNNQRKRELPWNKGSWMDSSQAGAVRQVAVRGVSETVGTTGPLLITYTAKPALARLTESQINLVTYEVMVKVLGERIAVEADDARRGALASARQAAQQIAGEIEGKEAERLRALLPQHSRMTYIGVPHVYDGRAPGRGPIGSG